MNNPFFAFCKKYWPEIVEFFESFYAWVKSLIDDSSDAE